MRADDDAHTPEIVQASLAQLLQQRCDNSADDADVIDVPQVARLLHVGRNTIYALVARNQIPHRRLGKAIRLSRRAVMSWLSSWSSRDAKEGQ